jgi:hypothetical protein
MKIGKKIRKDIFGVSPLVGVMLMVVIVVAIGASVYLNMVSLVGGTGEKETIPHFAINIYNNRIIVTKCDQQILWNDFSIKTNNPDTTVSINDGTPYLVGTDWYVINTTNWYVINTTNFGISGYVNAGNYFIFGGTDVSGYITISIRHDITNTLLGQWIVHV